MYTIVGYNPVSFPDEKTGELIEGVTFHLVSDETSSGIKHGCEVLSKFFSKDKISGEYKLGDECDLKFSVTSGKAKITGIVIIN